jgi:hypothetical protein
MSTTARAKLAATLVVATVLVVACSSNDSSDSTDAGGWAAVHCTNSDNTTTPTGGCTRSYSGCSDGHSYGIECEAGACTCRIDTNSTGHGISTGSCGADGLAGLAAICDWHQH